MDSSTSVDGPSSDEKLFDSSMLGTSSLYMEEIRAFKKKIRKSEARCDFRECKEFEITPISKEDLESQIIATKVEGILKRTLEQILISGCWPLFLKNNAEKLKMFLQSNDFDVITNGLSELKLNYKASKINPMEIVAILMQNKPLLNFVAENKPKIHSVALELIEALEIFKEHILLEFQKSVKAKIKNQQKIKASYEGKLCLKVALNLLQEQFSKQEEEYSVKIEALNELIAEYKEKVEHKRSQIKLHIESLVSENQMKMLCGEANQTKLEEAARLSAGNYEELLKSNLESEKLIRKERRRKEAALQNLIQKYDEEALAKQAQIDELEEQMQNNQMQLDEWECLVFEQARVYKNYQRERENERLVELAKKLQEFQRNRAAIIIQRTWREYKAKKAARKKARKDKKKSKGKSK